MVHGPKAGMGGIGYFVTCKGELVSYRSAARQGGSPLQMEARALLEAFKQVQDRGILNCQFFSDCLILVQACNQLGPPVNCDWNWMAFSDVLQCWTILKKQPSFTLFHVDRELNKEADCLAKLGRSQQWDVEGFTFPWFLPVGSGG